MKRLNPKTGELFKQGDIREDGYIFTGYDTHRIRYGFFHEYWKDAIGYQLNNALGSARSRAKEKNVAFGLDKKYLESIMTSLCPVFGIPLSWGVFGTGNKETYNSPSLDRVIPELGYIKGNVVFISGLANLIKQDVSEEELYKVADWLHKKRKEVLNAFKDQLASLPTRTNQQGKDYSEYGVIFASRFGKDNNDTNDHSGTVQGQDVDHSAQASSGNSVGAGSKKMVPFSQLTLFEDYGNTESEIIRLDFSRRYLSD